ncbi:hypothetical protein DJ84_23605 [Halorubrum ezzemoulense]|nr:hypothetical protein DJ84_23605 [Halorubrum ezzemoulense]
MSDSIGRRFGYELAGQIVAALLTALLIVLLARLLEPEEYGLLFLAISILAIVEVISKLGIAKSAARYISDYKENDPGQIPHILKNSLIINLFSIILVMFVLIIGSSFISKSVGEDDLYLLLYVGSLYVASSTLMRFGRVSLQGFEDIKAASTVKIINRSLRLILVTGFVVVGLGALGALIGYILAFSIASIYGLAHLYIQYYFNFDHEDSIESGLRRRIVEYSLPLTVTDTASKVDKQLDTVLVGFFLDPLSVSFYTVSKQVVSFAIIPSKALGFTLSPTFGSKTGKGEKNSAARLYELAYENILLFYIPASIGLCIVTEPLIDTVFGNSYSGAIPVLEIMSFYLTFFSVAELSSNGLDYLGRARERAIILAVTTSMNVGLNIILIPTIGVKGAALATVITTAIYAAVTIYLIADEFSLNMRRMKKWTALAALTGVLVGIPAYLVLQIFSGMLGLGIAIMTGVAVYILCLIKYDKIDQPDLNRCIAVISRLIGSE